MTALLNRAVESLSRRSRSTALPMVDGCAPDCTYEYLCDANHRYLRQQCCYRPDCTLSCGSWVVIGSC
jgi:hypothetical protein